MGSHGILPMSFEVIFDLNTPTERAPSKLSENYKINEIGSPELKLWPFKIIIMPNNIMYNYHTCTSPSEPDDGWVGLVGSDSELFGLVDTEGGRVLDWLGVRIFLTPRTGLDNLQ